MPSPQTPTDLKPWQPGDRPLGQYEVRALLGTGSFGQVHRVFHLGWQLELAVKSPQPNLLSQPQLMTNFVQEAETWVNLGLHPHVASCYYVRSIEGCPRLFAELVDGGTLADQIKNGSLYRGPPLEILARTLDIAIQFAWGVDHAHRHGLIHQDIKPANVLLTTHGTVKVTDFGLAKAKPMAKSGSPDGTLITRGGGYTVAYAAPEQLAHQPLTRRTDVWGWGVSILELLLGKRTWASGNIAAHLLEECLRNHATPWAVPQIPNTLFSILGECFHADPDQRPHDLTILAERLLALYPKTIGKPYPRPHPKPPRDTADQLNNRALSLLDLERPKEAWELWQQALAAQPNHLEANFNRSLLAWRRGRITDDTLLATLATIRSSRPTDWLSTSLVAATHLEKGDGQAARELLRQCPPDPEDPAAEAAFRSLVETRAGDQVGLRSVWSTGPNAVRSLAVNREGSRLLEGGNAGSLRVWQLPDPRLHPEGSPTPLPDLGSHHAPITAVAMDSEGTLAASGDQNGVTKLWELATGKCRYTWHGHRDRITLMAIRDDRRLALSASFATLKVWNLTSGLEVTHYQGHPTTIVGAAWVADRPLVCSGDGNGAIHLWEAATGRLVRQWRGAEEGMTALALSPGGDRVAAASPDGRLRIWSLEKGQCLLTLPGHAGRIRSLVWSRQGSTLLSVCDDHHLRVWESESGRCRNTWLLPFKGSAGPVGIDTSPLGAACAGENGQIAIWKLACDLPPFQAPWQLCRIRDASSTLAAQTAFDQGLAVARTALAGRAWREVADALRQALAQPGFHLAPEAMAIWCQLYPFLPRGALRETWQQPVPFPVKGAVSHLELSEEGHHLLLVPATGGVAWIKTVAGDQASLSLAWLHHEVTAIAWSPDQQWLLIGDAGGGVHGRPAAPSDAQATPGFDTNGHAAAVTVVSFSPDGHFALSAGGDSVIKVWSAQSGTLWRTLSGHQGRVTVTLWGLDGTWILSGGEDGALRRWTLSSGEGVELALKESQWLEWQQVNTTAVTALAQSGDGCQALVGYGDGTLQQWNMTSNTCEWTGSIRESTDPPRAITALAVSLNGRLAVIGGADGTLNCWDLAAKKQLGAPMRLTAPATRLHLRRDDAYALALLENGQVVCLGGYWELRSEPESDQRDSLEAWIKLFLRQHTPWIGAHPSGIPSAAPPGTPSFRRLGQPVWDQNRIQALQARLGTAGYGRLAENTLAKWVQEIAKRQSPLPKRPNALARWAFAGLFLGHLLLGEQLVARWIPDNPLGHLSNLHAPTWLGQYPLVMALVVTNLAQFALWRSMVRSTGPVRPIRQLVALLAIPIFQILCWLPDYLLAGAAASRALDLAIRLDTLQPGRSQIILIILMLLSLLQTGWLFRLLAREIAGAWGGSSPPVG